MRRALSVLPLAFALAGCDLAMPNSPEASGVDSALDAFAWLAPVSADNTRPGRIIVFGDSFSDVGNLNLATGGIFAGPPYFEGRFTNGPVWVEELADRLNRRGPPWRGGDQPVPVESLTPIEPSLIGGTDYAWGGAESGDGVVFGFIPNVGAQVGQFLSQDALSGDELIVIWVGGNDAIQNVTSGGVGGNTPEVAVANMTDNIRDLADAGASHFVVPDLYPLGLAPLFAATPLADAANAWTHEFNALLAEELERLGEERGVEIGRLAVSRLVREMVDDPDEFDLANVTDQACGGCAIGTGGGGLVENPDDYLWWDQVHFTRVVHERIGRAATSLLVSRGHAGADR